MTEVRRLGRAAGENTATGAFQRVEQAVANFRQRNETVTDEEADEFRGAAESALYESTTEKYRTKTVTGVPI